MSRPLRMALIGGGLGSFIGKIHQMGAALGAGIDLVAGSFSSDPERSRAAGASYGVTTDRCYADHDALFAGEAARDDGIDLVAIATPNHLHLPAALAAIKAGVHIMSDKPATATLAEALDLQAALRQGTSLYALSYSYSGYPMVREARARVAAGEIGTVRKVVVTYQQGWLSAPLEQNNARAAWRTDRSKSGVGGASADIGVHAFHLAEYVSGQRVAELLGDARGLVSGRALDDDCNALLHFDNGASGVLVVSQIAFGERNGLSIQVFGDAGALHWAFDTADVLTMINGDGSTVILRPMSPGLLSSTPLAPGLGNGLIVPFAVLYRDFAAAIGGDMTRIGSVLPGIDEGVRSMRFIERVVDSSANPSGWTTLA
ncbi:Gfo/Idh/MocA family protein [Sphingomonas glacialis]|nr:Gfo/Idh/MocA family oxidoreductase [Sphingomonas glacialis]